MFNIMFLVTALAGPALADDKPAIAPSLGIGLAWDSNIYDSSLNETESWIGVLTPAILFSTPPSVRVFELFYQGQYGQYFGSSADNYADHALGGRALMQVGNRGRFDLTAGTAKGHYDRGSNLSQGTDPTSPSFPSAPDEFDRNNWNGEFRYGAEGARGRLTLGFGGNQLDYTNNTARTDFFDRDTRTGNAGIAVGLRQRTSIVLDARFADTRYDRTRPGQASLDGQDWRYLLGVSWEATAKTEGSIRLGRQRRSFDDPGRAKRSSAAWEVDVRWSPRQYSHLRFLTSRANEETIGVGAFIDRSQYRVEWTHEWGSGWESTAGWSRSSSDYVGSSRNEKSSAGYVGLRYPQGRLLVWEAGYRLRSRDSNVSELQYDGKLLTIGVNIGI